MMAHVVSIDPLKEYLQILEGFVPFSRKPFCCSVIEIFGEEYLRAKTEQDFPDLLGVSGARSLFY